MWPEGRDQRKERDMGQGRKGRQGSDEEVRDFILKTMRNH